MSRQPKAALARAVAEAVPDVLELHGVKPGVCILGVRIATYALRELGVPATALPVSLYAMNAVYRQMIEERGEDGWVPPEGDDAKRYMEEWRERGAWAVMLSDEFPDGAPPGLTDNRRGGWDGHLVVALGRRWLVDPTLGQIRRRQKQIEVPDGFAVEAPGFIAMRERTLGIDGPEGLTLMYRHMADKTYLMAPDWQLVKAGDPLVRAVVRRIEGKV